jgi:hypothetical protein
MFTEPQVEQLDTDRTAVADQSFVCEGFNSELHRKHLQPVLTEIAWFVRSYANTL